MGNRLEGVQPGAMSRLSRVGNPLLSGFMNVVYRTPVGDADCGCGPSGATAWRAYVASSSRANGRSQTRTRNSSLERATIGASEYNNYRPHQSLGYQTPSSIRLPLTAQHQPANSERMDRRTGSGQCGLDIPGGGIRGSWKHMWWAGQPERRAAERATRSCQPQAEVFAQVLGRPDLKLIDDDWML